MPNPKRKTSKTRRDKRRTHYKATAKQKAGFNNKKHKYLRSIKIIKQIYIICFIEA